MDTILISLLLLLIGGQAQKEEKNGEIVSDLLDYQRALSTITEIEEKYPELKGRRLKYYDVSKPIDAESEISHWKAAGEGAKEGAAGGALIGAGGGAAYGALVGTHIFPGLGTVAGGVIGGALAGMKGGLIGGTAGGTAGRTAKYLWLSTSQEKAQIVMIDKLNRTYQANSSCVYDHANCMFDDRKGAYYYYWLADACCIGPKSDGKNKNWYYKADAGRFDYEDYCDCYDSGCTKCKFMDQDQDKKDGADDGNDGIEQQKDEQDEQIEVVQEDREYVKNDENVEFDEKDGANEANVETVEVD